MKTEEEYRSYELGYLLTPLIPEQQLAEKTDSAIRQLVIQSGGVILVETPPRLTTLAYPIKKVVENKGIVFKEAYFGSLAFQCLPAKLEAVTTALKNNPLIIRFLLIQQQLVLVAQTKARIKPAAQPLAPARPAGGGDVGGEATEAARQKVIDQEIEELLVPPK